jgi:hypothetical protein
MIRDDDTATLSQGPGPHEWMAPQVSLVKAVRPPTNEPESQTINPRPCRHSGVTIRGRTGVVPTMLLESSFEAPG